MSLIKTGRRAGCAYDPGALKGGFNLFFFRIFLFIIL